MSATREELQRAGLERAKPVLIDLGLFLVVLGPTTAWVNRSVELPYALLLGLVQTLPLLLRRRYPLAVFALVIAAAFFFELRYGALPPFASALAMYTVAAHVDRRTSLHAGLAGLIVLSASPLFLHGQSEERTGHLIVLQLVGFAVAWMVGDNMRSKRAYYRELEERAERLERDHEESARRAATEEQARIARELHDVIAHSVSVMVVQAAAAGDVFERQPERAREALRSIETTGRSALTELRRLLGVVRATGPESREPQPGLADLDKLVEQVRSTGLEVALEIEGELKALPVGVDLSAYRIVQEALTNTLKHASATSARVRLQRSADELGLVVSDNGSGSADPAPDGQGLIGMRERAALLGGSFETGAGESGGFAVRARFPLEPEAGA
jgi:signal transduction histidine kinase